VPITKMDSARVPTTRPLFIIKKRRVFQFVELVQIIVVFRSLLFKKCVHCFLIASTDFLMKPGDADSPSSQKVPRLPWRRSSCTQTFRIYPRTKYNSCSLCLPHCPPRPQGRLPERIIHMLRLNSPCRAQNPFFVSVCPLQRM
jgi:hypothetical protein